MAQAFRRRGDRFVARMDPDEVAVVVALLDQTRALLEPSVPQTGDAFTDLVASLEPTEEAEPSERDPALRRLLPDAHHGDPQVAAEFRRLTEQGLRQRKHATLTAGIEALTGAQGDTVTLSRAEAESLVVALTDARLLLGQRLGLETDADAERLTRALAADPLDPGAYAIAVYDFLTWMQDSLTTALMGRRRFR